MRNATVHLVYCEIEDEDGGVAPSWSAELFVDDAHAATHSGQMIEAVLGGVGEVLTRRVEPAEPRAGFPSDRGWATAHEATAALRDRAGLTEESHA